MPTTNYLAGRSMGSFKNHAIEHLGKGMKSSHIPAKGDDRVSISAISTMAVRGTLIH